MTALALDLNARIDAFVAHVNDKVSQHYARSFSQLTTPTHVAEKLSDKWTRINVVKNGRTSSVYCFICTKDGETKALGKVVAGDIHKAAGFKAPAKHSRGTVFSEDFNGCADIYGVKYLRG
jgi:hypothetical protein